MKKNGYETTGYAHQRIEIDFLIVLDLFKKDLTCSINNEDGFS